MALKKCKECGKEVSTKARSCPNCGASRQKQFGCLSSFLIIGGVILFIIILTCILGLPNPNTARNQSRSHESSGAGITVGGNTPKEDSRQVRQMIATAIGSDGLSFEINDYYASPEQKIIQVRFDIDDNLTDGMIRSSARSDITSILRAVDESGINCYEVTVYGSFPLVDKYGNSEREVVVKATYSGATIKRVNWSDFLTDNVYTIADSAWLHPAFRD